ncbi:MAG: hypothetical protein P4L77_11070 [Sulfuriferula sp.]|nr:hypothetical protein [Sulfuriferula sp.]
MIPQYLILNTETDAARLNWLVEQFPVADGEVFRDIMECLAREHDALMELDILGHDISTMLVEGGYLGYERSVVRAIVEMGKDIFSQLQTFQAYRNGILLYCFHEDFNGALVLKSYESADFDGVQFKPQMKLGRPSRRDKEIQ